MQQPKYKSASNQDVVDLEERTWLAAHIRGDQHAFAKLMQAYRKPVYSLLVRYGLDSSARDDLFQEAFLKIHKSAHTYQASKPLSPWIFTIVINTIRNAQRKQQPLAIAIDETEEIEDRQPTPEKSAQLDETLNWLEHAVIQLPQAQAEAFTLSIVKGMKIKEVGEILGLPINTIKTQLRRARQTLLAAFQAKKGSQSMTSEQSRTSARNNGVPHE